MNKDIYILDEPTSNLDSHTEEIVVNFILKYFKRENSINQKDMIVVKVKGMMCNHCKANVEKNLLALEGVTSVEVSLEKGEAKVEGNVSELLIKETIKNIGYEVE